MEYELLCSKGMTWVERAYSFFCHCQWYKYWILEGCFV